MGGARRHRPCQPTTKKGEPNLLALAHPSSYAAFGSAFAFRARRLLWRAISASASALSGELPISASSFSPLNVLINLLSVMLVPFILLVITPYYNSPAVQTLHHTPKNQVASKMPPEGEGYAAKPYPSRRSAASKWRGPCFSTSAFTRLTI